MAPNDENITDHRLLDTLNERDKRYEQRFAAQEQAISKSYEYYEKRLDSLNELRGVVNDTLNKTVTRNEWDAGHRDIMAKVDSMDTKMIQSITAFEGASKNNDRRLDDLNHVRDQLREQNATFVPRETYEAQHMFLAARLDAVQTRAENLEKLAANAQGKMWMLFACLGAGFTVIQILLRFFIK